MDKMTFSQALEKMKEGKAVKRVSWHFDATLAIMPGYESVAANVVTSIAHDIKLNSAINVAAYFSLMNKNENTLYMWTPRTVDILAEDWIEVAKGE